MTQATAPRRGLTVPPVVGKAFDKARASLSVDEDANPAVVAVTRVLGAVALLALWLVVFALVLSSLAFSHAQADLYRQFRATLHAGTAPISGPIAEGTPVALISAAGADLKNVVVVEGSSGTDLRDAPGHRPGTVLPGQAGASLLLGRASSFGAPFAGIATLDKGDPITVVTGQGTFHYAVEDVRRAGDPLPAPLKSGGSQLTLVTSESTGWRSGWAPSRVVYVDALLKGTAAPATALSGTPAKRDDVLARDTRDLYPLVLWLQLALLAAIGGVWVRGRWGATLAWSLAVPVGLAGLWGASVAAWPLLPNLL